MSDENDTLVSVSGAPIWKHKARERDFEFAIGSEDLEAIEEHIARCVAAPDFVFHEIVSDLVHIDVHIVPADTNRNFVTLITTGMSDRPMTTPDGADKYRYSELLIELPPHWPLGDEAFKDEKNYWPIRMLKKMARLPHEYETWLWSDHSVENGDPPQPYHSSVKFTGCMRAPAVNLSPDLVQFSLRPDKEVYFFAVIPLYPEEMNLKLRKGADALFDAFERHGVTELIDPNRRNVAKRSWFGW